MAALISYLAMNIVLLVITYQDFKDRAIDWFLPVLMLAAAIGIHYYHLRYFNYVFIGINLIFILLQLLILSLYFSAKTGKWVDISKKHLGLGDILFFIPLAFLFSPMQFILFFVISLLLILISILILKLTAKTNWNNIPLAGAMSIILILELGWAEWGSLNLYNDFWMLNLF